MRGLTRRLLLGASAALPLMALPALARGKGTLDARVVWDDESTLNIPPLEIYARKGEVTACENGHPLGEFTRDVIVGEIAKGDELLAYPPMKIGHELCPHCGGSVVEPRHGQHYYFVNDGAVELR